VRWGNERDTRADVEVDGGPARAVRYPDEDFRDCSGDSAASRLTRRPALTNNEAIVRKAIAIALSLAVQAAALSAPLVHAHPDDHATEHHGARAVHSHWAGHSAPHGSSGHPALEADDHDRAVFLGAFAAAAVSPRYAPGVMHAVFALPLPVEGVAHRGVEVAHGHDPPVVRTLPSRAPPAHLS
jgi:hypothetical protein